MLVHLSVHNYAIVEHLDLELDRGMSVITGVRSGYLYSVLFRADNPGA